MIENEMGYRGSKFSAIALVKEQRVDGSYSFLVKLLKCTLMAPVRGYQTEILSKKIISVKIQLLQKDQSSLNQILGFLQVFLDAEGYFSIELYKDSKAKFKFSPSLIFGFNLHVKDLPILLSFKDTLGVGTVSTKGKVTS